MGKKKTINTGLGLFFVGLVAPIGLLSATTVHAQIDVPVNAQTQVIIEPAQLTVAGMRGAVETRSIFLRTANPIKNPQLIPLDLNRTDGSAVLPAEAISMDQASVLQTKPNELTALVKFNLHRVPSSGEFSGKLRLSYQDGEEYIPVTVRVKDPWVLPLIALLVGTGLGVGVSVYRALGRPRDEILTRVGQLRALMQEDRDLAKAEAFQSRVDGYLVDVRIALGGERWEDAQNALKQAETVWSKWSKARADWLAQLAYADKINQRMLTLDPNIPYLQTVGRHLEEAVRDAPDMDSPGQFRDRLEEIAQQLNRYIQLQREMEQLSDLSTKLPVDGAAPWQFKLQNLEQRMEYLQPSDLTKDTNLQTEVEEAIAQITKLVSPPPATQALLMDLPKSGLTTSILAPPPSVRPQTWEERASAASLRLRAFTVGSYVIAIVFLGGTGFSQLYVDQPTFGANPWKDYFALLAWGFGAEVTRDAIMKVVQGLGVPGLKWDNA